MVLFKALEMVKLKTDKVRVVIVGDVLYTESIEYARAKGLGDQIKIYGRCEHKKALSLISQCDAEIHDLDGYGVGIADQEAMALGKTVVVGGREDNFGPGILKNWENIVIFPPSDHEALAQAILKLIEDPSLRDRIGTGARQLIEDRFTWDTNARRTVELYNTLLNNR
jgi:glycosyltransferase involved in cell wall biosynthesis